MVAEGVEIFPSQLNVKISLWKKSFSNHSSKFLVNLCNCVRPSVFVIASPVTMIQTRGPLGGANAQTDSSLCHRSLCVYISFRQILPLMMTPRYFYTNPCLFIISIYPSRWLSFLWVALSKGGKIADTVLVNIWWLKANSRIFFMGF